jgi:MFS family permease
MQQAQIRADSKTGRGVVAIALTAGLVAAAHVGELPPALPAIRAELGLDLISAAYLASLFSVTGMLVAVFIGVLADRVNHWRLAVAGLTLMALSGFAGSFAGSGSQLLASRFLEGIGFLAVVVAAPSLIAETATGRDRQMALGLWPGYMPGGVSIAILLAPLLLAAGGWRGLWIALAAVSAGFAALMLIAARTPSRVRASANRGTGWTSLGAALARPGPWLIAGCFALYGAQLYAFITWMPTLMIEERGISPASAASLTALAVVINGLSNIAGGWLLHRDVASWAIIATAGVAGICGHSGVFAFAGSGALYRGNCALRGRRTRCLSKLRGGAAIRPLTWRDHHDQRPARPGLQSGAICGANRYRRRCVLVGTLGERGVAHGRRQHGDDRSGVACASPGETAGGVTGNE